MSTLSVVIIARDEQEMLPGAVASASFADEVLVVDGGSADRTVDVARLAGARVVERPFDDFARQRNFALDAATGEWVLFVDADERVTAGLADEVRARIADAGEALAWNVPRVNIALGKRLDWHPGGGSDAPLRLQRRLGPRWSGAVHEVLDAPSAGALTEHLVHLTHRSVSEVVRKIDHYSELEAAALAASGAKPPTARAILASFPRAAWQLWRSGLRSQGVEGAVEACLLAFNRTLVLAKVWERTRAESLAETYRRIEAEIETERAKR